MFLTPESEANFRGLVEALKGGNVAGKVTAFIGAGLSVPLQPTWSRLHADLQRETGIRPIRPFDAAFAPADFADFRDALPPDRYLAILKERFGGVVTDYPPLYRVIDETQGFEQLVTTNYDEFLATAAHSSHRRPSIMVFPNFGDLGGRYVYLHGRARSARKAEDLVLCEDDYGRAYEVPGWAADMLRALFMRPGVFIGSSLQDPDLLALLRRRSRLRAGDGALPEPALFAIVPVSPAKWDRGEGAMAAAASIAERRLHRLGVRAVCYARDRGHTQLRATLLQLQHSAERRPVETVFLDRTRHLNRLGAIADPSPAEVAEVVETISGVPELARHFFATSATSDAWYDALKDSVIVPGVVEPWDIGGGRRMIGRWAAAPLVQRLAPQRPGIVAELVRRLATTENWQAQSVLSRLAADLPDEELAAVLPILVRWIRGPNAALNRAADDLAPVPDRLSERGALGLALTIVGHLLQPRTQANEDRGELRADEYRYPQLRAAVERLMAGKPGVTYRMLKARLLKALAVAGPEVRLRSDVWRSAIGEDEQNFLLHRTGLHFLLDATRDALLAWLVGRPADAVRELDRLLPSEDVLLQRIALHALTDHPELIPRLRTEIVTEERFWTDEAFHELAALFSQRFGDLDDGSQSLVHRLIAEGPPPQRMAAGENRKESVDYYRWRWLAVIPGQDHTADEREWWAELRRRWGKREHPLFLFWHGPVEMEHVPSDVVEASVVRAAWQTGGAPALVAVLRKEEGAWGPLADLIREDPEGLHGLAAHLGPQDKDCLVSYFSGYESLLGNQAASPTFPWDPLIDLMERTTQGDLDNLRGTAGQIARLIERGTTSEGNAIPADLLARAQAVAVRILDRFARPLATDPEQGGRIGRHHQLNHTAGQAADAFMRVVWQQLYFLREEEERRLPEGARPWLDAAVERGWGGPELRHALGEFWFVVQWGEPGWLVRHASRLWPAGDESVAGNARRAFLFGYLQARQWSRASLVALLPLYHDVVRDLAREQREYLDEQELIEPFVRHLVLGWLNDVDGFDGVLDDFLASAPDGERARFVRLLGREYLAAEEGVDFEATIRKREAFWERRVAELGARLPVTERSEELSAFCSWVSEYRRSLARLETRLRVSIEHLAGGQGAISALLECFVARGEAEPLPAARLLEKLVDRLFGDEDLFWGWHGDKFGEAIDTICRGALPHHRVHLRAVVNRLLQADVADFSDKLARCGSRRTGHSRGGAGNRPSGGDGGGSEADPEDV